MPELNPEQREILLQIRQAQHEESLAHRGAILNAFGLSVAGLAALAAGAIAPGYITDTVRAAVLVVVAIVWLFVFLYVRSQRQASQDAMNVVRKIDKELGLFDNGRYLAQDSVLPESYADPQPTFLGLSRRVDSLLILVMAFLGLAVIALAWVLPARPPCP